MDQGKKLMYFCLSKTHAWVMQSCFIPSVHFACPGDDLWLAAMSSFPEERIATPLRDCGMDCAAHGVGVSPGLMGDTVIWIRNQ